MKTDNPSLDKWQEFFLCEVKDNNYFLYLLERLDTSFLTQENSFDADHPFFDIMPQRGFLEADFLRIRDSLDEDGFLSGQDKRISSAENTPLALSEKTRLVLALAQGGVNFSSWVKAYDSQDISLVFIKSLIEGDYEIYGVALEKIVKNALSQKLIDGSDFISVAVIRGALLGQRYSSDAEKEKLSQQVRRNKRKRDILHIFKRLLGKKF